MITKFLAILTDNNGQYVKTVTVYEAKRLEKNGDIETNKYEKAVLYDLGLEEKVYPVIRLNKTAFFRYYEGHKRNLSEREEYSFTPLRILFVTVFEGKQDFLIQESSDFIRDYRQKKLSKKPSGKSIRVKSRRNFKLRLINTGEDKYFVDIYLELSETYPYSFYYKWNGVLCLEFNTTSRTRGRKARDLREAGYFVFESEPKFPKWTDPPEEFVNEEQYYKLAEEISKTYDRDYKLVGDFLGEGVTNPEFKEKYEIMSDFERQCAEMNNDIKRLTDEKEQKQARLNELEESIKLKKKELAEETERHRRLKAIDDDWVKTKTEHEEYTKLENRLCGTDGKFADKFAEMENSVKSLTIKNNSIDSQNERLISANEKLSLANKNKIIIIIIAVIIAAFVITVLILIAYYNSKTN